VNSPCRTCLLPQILDAPEWINDARYHDKQARSVHRDALNAEINKRLALHDRSHWIERFNRARRAAASTPRRCCTNWASARMTSHA
jgi:crotonobetainyl-CoA:carnitine CoA-transferase CaiB-like acyl-CoA transferase